MSDSNEEFERTMRLSHFTIEQAPDAILWLDSEGRIHRVNEAACQIFGYTRDEVIGVKAYELHPEENEELWRQRWAKLKENNVLTFEKYQPTKDRRMIPIEVTQNLIEFEGNEYSCSFIRDITERKRAEEALKKALTEVEQLKNRLQEENLYLQQEIKLTHNFEEIICQSDVLKKVLGKVEQVASTDATVLILGETGTGKELIARAVHSISPRRDRPLVKVNCATLPANLIESELFGHEKGAFTGALSRKIGRFELADGGTVFLDEIGDLPLELQVKLLRVLQDGKFERLGNPGTIKVDIRVIAATNRDLKKSMGNGSFREDLYYRLNVFPINVPPLRERKDDIPLLVKIFIQKFSTKVGKQIEKVPQKVMDRLLAYYWPGNVRELENIIECAVIVCQGKRLELGDWLPKTDTPSGISHFSTLEENERQHIIEALEITGWRVSGEKGAAKILGINPKTLESRMKKLIIKQKSEKS